MVFVSATHNSRGPLREVPLDLRDLSLREMQRIATLKTRTVGWIAVAVLMLRTVALPISVANIRRCSLRSVSRRP